MSIEPDVITIVAQKIAPRHAEKRMQPASHAGYGFFRWAEPETYQNTLKAVTQTGAPVAQLLRLLIAEHRLAADGLLCLPDVMLYDLRGRKEARSKDENH
jgi:hypothetical protein